MTRLVIPPRTLLDGSPYIPATATDITKTWRKHGWLPREESLLQQMKRSTVTKLKEARHASR
jgi:hypothetical protein